MYRHDTHDLRTLSALRLMPRVRQLALSMAQRLPSHVSVDDLVAAGNLGLADALNRHEDTNAEWFDGYALQRIRGAMLDELRGLDALTRAQRGRASRVAATATRLANELGRAAEHHEIARAAGMTQETYWKTMETVRLRSPRNFDTVEADAEISRHLQSALALPDQITAEEHVIERSERRWLHHAVQRLPRRLRLVLVLYYEHEKTFREIGSMLGVSEPRVHQLRNDAVSRLRAFRDREDGAVCPQHIRASHGMRPGRERRSVASMARQHGPLPATTATLAPVRPAGTSLS